jgi:protocatechuate 3,4-dioxygenase beta subunit
MPKSIRSYLGLLLIVFLLAACQGESLPANEQPVVTQPPVEAATEAPLLAEEAPPTPLPNCAPTPPDQLGPFYVAGAPERDQVGQGYVVSGRVFSVEQCRLLPGAQIEIWLAGPDGEYADDYRATLVANKEGAFRFESDFPPPYSNRPPHIHFRVSAAGHTVLVTQHYPVEGQSFATFDLVLSPDQ